MELARNPEWQTRVRKEIRAARQKLEEAGVGVLFDDRKKVSPGVRFGDFELLGVPSMLVIGRGLADGLLEIKDRATGESREIRREDVVAEGMMEVTEVEASGVETEVDLEEGIEVDLEAATEAGSGEDEGGKFIIPWIVYLVHR